MIKKLLMILALAMITPWASAQQSRNGCETVKIEADTPVATAVFGALSDILVNRIVIGAPFDDSIATNNGKVYTYTRSGSNWNFEQELEDPSPAANESFGSSVRLAGEWLAIAAPFSTNATGSVLLYRLESDVWTLQQVITVGGNGDHPGEFNAMDLTPNYLVVGTHGEGSGGRARVYEYDSNLDSWIFAQNLTPTSNPGNGDDYGNCVSVNGNVAMVAAQHDGAGTVTIFRRELVSPFEWLQETVLAASDETGSDDSFGRRMDYKDPYLVVGAIEFDGGGTDAGAFYVYRDAGGGSWVEEGTRLQGSLTSAGDLLGHSVAINGTTLVAGARDAAGGGEAYIFRRNMTTGEWEESIRLQPSDLGSGDQFGSGTSMSASRMVIGADFGDGTVTDSGTSYTLKYTQCPIEGP